MEQIEVKVRVLSVSKNLKKVKIACECPITRKPIAVGTMCPSVMVAVTEPNLLRPEQKISATRHCPILKEALPKALQLAAKK